MERMNVWDEMVRLGKPEVQVTGFPMFDEMDMKTVHEAYQYLCLRFVDELISAPNTFALLHKTFLRFARPNLAENVKIDFTPDKLEKRRGSTPGNILGNSMGLFFQKVPIQSLLNNNIFEFRP